MISGISHIILETTAWIYYTSLVTYVFNLAHVVRVRWMLLAPENCGKDVTVCSFVNTDLYLWS